jgi:cytochrome P450
MNPWRYSVAKPFCPRYLEYVIKESLRLDPTASGLGKVSLNPVEVLGYKFNKGVLFIVDVLSVHRSEKYWDSPLTFNPDRWDNGFTPRPGTYLPFGDGATNCIGQKIAMMEMKVILVRLLQRYRFEICPGQDLSEVTTVTTGLKDGLDVFIDHV